jgi:hypothetical protein
MSGSKAKELERLGVLGIVAVWLLHPFATGRLYGSGDALWYANMLADYVLQFRAGIFPIFVGQTEFAFNGAVYPLRVCPMYQHLAGFLDLLTGRSLSFIWLQHLTVIVCGIAGLFASYLTLCRIAPTRRWEAVGFSTLYLSCPGLLATIYTQDLYMTWMTVPFAPLAVYGIIRTFQKDDIASQVWLAAPLAALWWAHSPIALWFTFIAAASQLIRLAFLWNGLDPFKRTVLGAMIFAVLAQYPFVSVSQIHSPGTDSTIVGTLKNADDIPKTVRSVFPAAVLPLSDHARELSDLQLGYAFWTVLFFAGATVVSIRRMDLAFLLGSSTLLLILVLPFPGLNQWLWDHIPSEIVRITFYWPMQRFYLILAALLAAAGQIALDAALSRSGRPKVAFFAVLAVGSLWSLYEARQFVAAASERTRTEAETTRAQLLENIILMNHSYGLFTKLPAYFSNGVVDPRSEARLLSPDTGKLIPAPEGKIVQSGTFVGAVDPNPGVLDLSPTIHLEPGHWYQIEFTFARENYDGVLQLSGRSIFREYVLPSSGERLAFGDYTNNSRAVDIWTSAAAGDDVEIRFIPATANEMLENMSDFGSFILREPDHNARPLDVISLFPFLAKIRLQAPSLLESPRVFMPGYIAKVDGHEAKVLRSDEGLAEVLVPSGNHTIDLTFKAPVILSLSYWVAILAWTSTLSIAAFATFRVKN